MNSKAENIIPIEALEGLRQTKEFLLTASEEELVAACQAGDRRAQKRVYELFSGRMLNICRRYAQRREQAQDLMHDGFIKVFLNIGKFRGQAALSTWITRIMINHCISAIRKEVKKGIRVNLDDVKLSEGAVPEFELVEKSRITAQQVFEAITRLPLGYRTVLSMYLLDDYSHKEIAEELDITVGTSKSQLAKAKKFLVKLLTEDEL